MSRGIVGATAVFVMVFLSLFAAGWVAFRFFVHPVVTSFSGQLPKNTYFAVVGSEGCKMIFGRDLEKALEEPNASMLVSGPLCAWKGGTVERLQILESSPTHQVIRVTHSNTGTIRWQYRTDGRSVKLESYQVLYTMGDTLYLLPLLLIALWVARLASGIWRVRASGIVAAET